MQIEIAEKKREQQKGIFVVFAKGVLMGTADIIPGISGGTIALITGIYERLVGSISAIDFRFIAFLLKGERKKAIENFKRIDFPLFIPLLSGIALAIFLMSSLIYYLLENHPSESHAFFFGAILASAAVVYKSESIPFKKGVLPLASGFLLAFLIVGLPSFHVGYSMTALFFSAAVSICAMILPGISGAAVLLLLNQYEHMLFAVKHLKIPEIAVFCCGALVGILSFSRLVKYFLRTRRIPAMSLLIGLMVGALRLPLGEAMNAAASIWPVLIWAALGFAAVYLPELKFGKKAGGA